MYDTILVPTDGSELAEAAVEHAIAVAERAGARVHAVNVVDVRAAAASRNVAAPTTVIDNLESGGERATDAIADRAREAGLEAVTEVREGHPTDDLLAYAREADVDLVAMGTHGRTGLNRFILGSTAERVVRRSPVPVLTVNGHPGSAE